MKREVFKRIIATVMLVIIVAIPVAVGSAAAGNGTAETQFAIDWTNVELTEGGATVPYYAVLKSEDGYYFYIVNDMECDEATMYVTHNDKTYEIIHLVDVDGVKVYDKFFNEIEGATAVAKYDEGTRYTEIFVPMSYIGKDDFIVASQDSYYVLFEEVNGQDKGVVWSDSIKSADSYKSAREYTPNKPDGYETITAKAPSANYDDVQGTYSGIEIDGSFSDWDSIAKTTTRVVEEEEKKGSWIFSYTYTYYVDMYAAIIWDDKDAYVYMGFVDVGNSAAVYDGLVETGTYYIMGDNGRIITFNINKKNSSSSYAVSRYTISGVNNAEIAAVSAKNGKMTSWYYEMKIPVSALGSSATSIRLAYMGQEGVRKTVTEWRTNLAPDDDDDDDDDDGGDIVADNPFDVDGDFGDWEGFPNSNIYYCTQNHSSSQCPNHYKDYAHEGHTVGSAFIANDQIVAHIKSYTSEEGSHVCEPMFMDIIIRVNNSAEVHLTAQAIEGSSTQNRTYTMLLADNYEPVGELKLYDDGTSLYEFEYGISIEKLAARLGIGATELRTIEIGYPNIGSQWIKVAGTSTAPFVGIAICFAVVGITWFVRFMKDKKVAA